MLNRIKMMFGLLLLVLLLAGCVAPLPVSLGAVPSTPVAVEEAGDDAQAACPEPTAEQVLVHNEAAGYCFTIPAGYEAEYFEATGSVVVLAPATTEGHRERLFIDMQEALGRSLDQVTEQALTDFSIPGMEVEGPSAVTVGGEPATLLGNLPGQDLNRRLLVVHDGRVYQMMFIPDDPAMAEAYTEMETLFAAVMDSFTFIPPTAPMGLPLPATQESGYPADAALSWERRIRGDGGAIAECHRLAIAADGATWAGSCEQADVETQEAPFQWTEILDRFAPFVYRSGEWDLVFAGQGDIYHPVWQRALVAWAQISYGETVSGQVSATSRTALSWWLGEEEGEEGLCRHLVVLSHGYAYANVDPCAGGETQTVAEGWLETAEMEAFHGWLYSTAPTYVEDNYLDGRGEQELNQEATEQLTQWAENVYQRLRIANTQ
jgi:hypothetical protein